MRWGVDNHNFVTVVTDTKRSVWVSRRIGEGTYRLRNRRTGSVGKRGRSGLGGGEL